MSYTLKAERLETHFAQVPNALCRDTKISEATRCFLIWFASQTPGYEINAMACRNALGLSDHKWRKVRKELTEIGAIIKTPVRTSQGVFIYHSFTVTLKPWVHGGSRYKTYEASLRPPEAETDHTYENHTSGKKAKARKTSIGTKNPQVGKSTELTSKTIRPQITLNTIKAEKPKKPSLEERHAKAVTDQQSGRSWIEPTSNERMPATAPVKSLRHYKALERL